MKYYKSVLRFFCCRLSVLLTCAALGLASAWGSSPSLPGALKPFEAPTAASNPPPEAKPEDLKARREEVAQRLQAAQKTLDSETVAPGGQPNENLSDEVELLKQLDVLYAQRQSADESRQQLAATKTELEQKLSDLRRDGPTEPRPYSFVLLDSLRDTLSTEQSRLETMAAAVSAAADALEHAKAADVKQQAERRRAKEAAEGTTDKAKIGERATQLKLAELEACVSQESVNLCRADLEYAKSTQRASQIRLTLLQETLASMEKDTLFAASDLQQQLVNIGTQEAKLKRDLDSAEMNGKYLDADWTAAHQRLGSATRANPELNKEEQAAAMAALKEEEQAAALAQIGHRGRTELLQKQLARLSALREGWRRRFAVATGDFTRAELMTWTKETHVNLDQLDVERRLEEALINEKRKDLADLEKRLQAAKADPGLAQWIEREQSLYQRLISAHSENLVKLEEHRKLHESLLNEIGQKTRHHTLADAWVVGSQAVVAVWTYALIDSGDSSITVGKVCSGLVLMILGVMMSRRLAKVFAHRILSHLGIHNGAVAAVQSLAFYMLVVISALTALHMVNVPLTLFTFMGGAVAIGVGFGSQNILNNFISGVIMLIERPIRVGDIIELGNLAGTVESIGTRSTRIRTGTNSEIIVPNSTFLETNVINWTLSDSTLRTSVRVGLSHGSNTRDVARWLKRAADEHGLVLKKPEPFVWFSDFGESALVFELHFWIDVATRADRRRVESDLRFMIDQYFREAGIIIAFPQREMHLHSAQPLEIRLRPPALEATLEAKASNKAA